MELSELLLKKDELPIKYGNIIIVPIHPILIKPETQLDPNLAHQVFPQAAKEWYTDLQEYAKTDKAQDKKDWIGRLLKEEPRIVGRLFGPGQKLSTINWEDEIFNLKNGFASSLSISRDFGGTLYLESITSSTIIGPERVNLTSVEKFQAYKCKDYDTGEPDRVFMHMYDQHNIDHHPGALFLRNWAMLYLNAALTQAYEQD